MLHTGGEREQVGEAAALQVQETELLGLLPLDVPLQRGMVSEMRSKRCLEVQARDRSAAVSSEEYSA